MDSAQMEGRRGQVSEVTARAAELTAALEVGAPWLDPALVERAIAATERSVQRLQLGAGHTVVALVGATGSGKSSLFNALARMEIAQVGARRPLTSQPMACVWGEGGSQQLLDWLQVPPTRRITRESVLDADYQAPLHGLVLLDLPDHDSTEAIHRVEVDRLVDMVDLLVWVVDPQKYADDALHSGYLQRLAGHTGVMVVVLNQIDRLTPDEAATCERDLRRLLDADGLSAVRMLPVSAKRGDGVDELRSLLAGVVQDQAAIADRIHADLRATTDAVLTGLAPIEPGNGEPPGAERLLEELAAAAGVPTVIDALAASFRRLGWKQAGWPLLAWLRRLDGDRYGWLTQNVAEGDLQLIAGTAPPVSARSQRSRVELAVDAATSASAETLPTRWASAVRSAVRPGDELGAMLDEQVAAVDLRLAPPAWWWLVAAAQYVLTLAAGVGAIWLMVIGWLRIGSLWIDYNPQDLIGRPLAHPVHVLGLPLPWLLLVVGLFAGAVLAALTAWALTVGAARRRLSAQGRLRAAVESVVYEQVVVPIRVVLAQHRATRLALLGAGAGPSGTGDAGSSSAPAPTGTAQSPATTGVSPPAGPADREVPGAREPSAAQRLAV
jgi:GTPase Era involved in 16S rRNA processing